MIRVGAMRWLVSTMLVLMACTPASEQADATDEISPTSPTAAPTAAATANAPQTPWFRLPVSISSNGVLVPFTLDGREVYLNLDTASWFSSLDPDRARAAGVSPGRLATRWGFGADAFDVGKKELVALPRPAHASAPDAATRPVVGTAGNNMFAGMRIAFDPRRGEILLAPRSAGRVPLDGVGTPLVIRGEHVLAPDLRPEQNGIFVLPCAFDERPASTCMFDTGAPPPPTVIGALAAGLEAASSREVPAFARDFTGKLLEGVFRLAPTLELAGVHVADSQPVRAMVDFEVLEAEARYFKRDIQGLIGIMLQYVTVLDMEAATLQLYPYSPDGGKRAPERSYFLGHGVIPTELVSTPGGTTGARMRVVRGSAAEAAGLRQSDLLVGIGGDYTMSLAGIVLDTPGVARMFRIARDERELDVSVVAEDLLRAD